MSFATKTLLKKIRCRAKALSRDGVSYQSALEALSVQAGFAGGWDDLMRAAGMSKPGAALNDLPTNHIPADMPLRSMPIWDRDTSELERWFERPFVAYGGPHNYPMILCLDGRRWDCASMLIDWCEEEDMAEALELGKRNYLSFLSRSDWRIRQNYNNPQAWNVVLCWYHHYFAEVETTETIYLAPDKENAMERVKFFRRIRQQRIQEFENLFSVESLTKR